jgi:hypothetical protein
MFMNYLAGKPKRSGQNIPNIREAVRKNFFAGVAPILTKSLASSLTIRLARCNKHQPKLWVVNISINIQKEHTTMPYRIKARNAIGNSVTRIDMNPENYKMDQASAKLLAEEFAQNQKHNGPWTGYVEYYDDTASIKSTVKQSTTDRLTATKPKPGKVPV